MSSYDLLIHSTLKNNFGFDTFRAGQEAVIIKILEGKSALAISRPEAVKVFAIS